MFCYVPLLSLDCFFAEKSWDKYNQQNRVDNIYFNNDNDINNNNIMTLEARVKQTGDKSGYRGLIYLSQEKTQQSISMIVNLM